MDNRQFYDRLANIEQTIKNLVDEMTLIRQESETVIKENHSLKLENDLLRSKLGQEVDLEPEANAEAAKSFNENHGVSLARQNLTNIYESGFHICNIYYGQRREEQEACVFCLDVLFGARTNNGKGH